ncbi:MAG: hypothetical protein EXS01_00130 [Phycisphaerales bacterium]|nr:hypothetical protein [Phycisphaerales bacterium]
MRDLLTLARRECAALFFTPTAWGALAIFTFLTGVITGIAVLVPGSPAELRTVAAAAGWAMLLTAPALSLRPTTEDRRTGFWEVLATSPASVAAIIGGRYLAGMCVLALLCAVGLGGPFAVLESVARPDVAEALCATIGVLLVGSAYLASGLFFGSITTSAAVAYLTTFFSWLVLLIAIRSLAPVLPSAEADLLFAADPVRRLEGFLNGALDSSNILYFLAVTGAFLFAAGAIQSTEAERGSHRSALGTRLRLALGIVGAFALAIGLAVVFHAPPVRVSIDATKSRGWVVNERTARMVAQLPPGWRATWIAPTGGLDSAVTAQLSEVLDSFAAVGGVSPIAHQRMDPSTPEGAAEYSQWVGDLVARRRGSTTDMLSAVAKGIEEFASLATEGAGEVPKISAVLADLPVDAADRQPIEQIASAFSALASGAPVFLQTLRTMQSQRPDRALPDSCEVADVLASNNRDWAMQLGQLASWLASREVDARAPDPVRRLALRMRPVLETHARALLRTVDTLDALARDQLTEVSIGLARGGGVVIESPSGVAFLTDDALRVNAADQGATVRFDRRFRMEQLIDGAIRSILDDQNPQLIVVHAEDRSMLTPASDGFDACAIADAARAARIVVREWRVTAEPRPIAGDLCAWMVITPRTVAVDRSASERALLEAVTGLVTEGAPIFLSIGPSLRPLAGRSDPWSEIAAALGARALSDAVIVDDIPVSEGETERRTKLDIAVIRSSNPLAVALEGQHLGFSVAIPVAKIAGDSQQTTSFDLLAAGVEPSRSVERDWRRRTPDPRSTKLLTEPISVAAAITRSTPGARAVRAIVVGSPSWMASSVVDSARSLGGGRDALLNPGNREFAVNGTLWLAGLDARLGNGGSGREAPRISPLSLGARLQYTAGLAVGLPMLSLLVGFLLVRWRSRS